MEWIWQDIIIGLCRCACHSTYTGTQGRGPPHPAVVRSVLTWAPFQGKELSRPIDVTIIKVKGLEMQSRFFLCLLKFSDTKKSTQALIFGRVSVNVFIPVGHIADFRGSRRKCREPRRTPWQCIDATNNLLCASLCDLKIRDQME